MAKLKWMDWVGIIITLFSSLAIGGLFVSGAVVQAFANIPLLSLLPLIVHQIIGWVIIILAVIHIVFKFIK